MSFDSDMDRFIRRLEGAMFDIADDYGGSLEDELARTLNVPYPPPSAPGETPHRRTGSLRAGLGHVTTAEGDLVIVEVTSVREPRGRETRNVPGILNFAMDRPYMTNLYTELRAGKFSADITRLIVNRVNSW